jgi:hypothetical protein
MPAKFTSYFSKMREQRLDPPISVPILKARFPAHDDGRRRIQTPPRARRPRWEQRKHAENLAGARPLLRQRVAALAG